MRKPIPLWLVLPLVLLLSAPGIFAAVSVTQTEYVAIFGEAFVITNELTLTTNGVDAATAARSAAGTDSGSPIALSGGAGGVARTAITKYDWTYAVEVSVATLSADTKYNVTLYMDGVSVASLYVQQGSSPNVGDKATLTWDIGSSLDSASFKVEIVTYA